MSSKKRCIAGGFGTAVALLLFFLTPGICFGAPEEPSISQEILDSIGLPGDSDIPGDYDIPEDFAIPEDWNLSIEPDESLTKPLSSADLEPLWDPGTSGFFYMLPNHTWFTMNVPVGAISTKAVSIELSDNLYVMHIERDGKLLDFSRGLSFSEKGDYQIVLNTAELESGKTPVIYRLPVTFTICGTTTNSLDTLEVPEGFVVRSAALNAEERILPDSLVVLKEDGNWSFTFVSRYDPRAVYELKFRLDRHAPELIFSKPIDQGAVTPPLKITATEEDCEILVQKGAETVPLPTGVLKSGGTYRVISRDSQGNERSYRVQIRYPVFRLTSRWILLLAVSAAGLVGYLLYLRRHSHV